MNPIEQRIVIAEACGWKLRKWKDKKGCHCSGWTTPSGVQCGGVPPEYLDDLNDMHEAEKMLTTNEQKRKYVDTISKMIAKGNLRYMGRWANAHATAEQRAEALLKTLNLWKES